MQAKQCLCFSNIRIYAMDSACKKIFTPRPPTTPMAWPLSFKFSDCLLLIHSLLLLPLCGGLGSVLVLLCVLSFIACFQIFLLKRREQIDLRGL